MAFDHSGFIRIYLRNGNMSKPEVLRRYTAASMAQAMQEAPADYVVMVCYLKDGTLGESWTFEMAVEIDHRSKVVRIWCQTT